TSSKSNKTPKHRPRRSPGGAKLGRAAQIRGKQGRGSQSRGEQGRSQQGPGEQGRGEQGRSEQGRSEQGRPGAAPDERRASAAGAFRSREDADRPSGSERRGKRRANELRGRPLVSSNRPPPGGGRFGNLTRTNAHTAL